MVVCIAYMCPCHGHDIAPIDTPHTSQVPRVWEVRREIADNAAHEEEDLLLGDELEALEVNENEEKSLLDELCLTYEEFAVVERDEAHARTYALTRVSNELNAEFKRFEAFKVESINRFRRGAACVDSTFANTKGATLRFLGWFSKYGPNACRLLLADVFVDARLGARYVAF